MLCLPELVVNSEIKGDEMMQCSFIAIFYPLVYKLTGFKTDLV